MLRAVSLVCGDEETLGASRRAAGDAGLTCIAAWSDAGGTLPARAAIADMLRGADAAFVTPPCGGASAGSSTGRTRCVRGSSTASP